MEASLVFRVVVLAATVVGLVIGDENPLARGWGDAIDWKSFEEGQQLAKSENKPLMLVIHKSWCGACKSLRPKFEASTEIAKLSKEFIMVNTVDDEEPMDSQFKQDGGYIPRIFFLTPAGDVMVDVYNEKGMAKYKYFYSDPKMIVTAMEKVMSARAAVKEDL